MAKLVALVVAVVGTVALVLVDALGARRIGSRLFRSDRAALAAIAGRARIRIAEAREGDAARVTGRVTRIAGPLEAPLSKRPCAYWEVAVREGPIGSFRAVARRHQGTRAVIEDGSGRAVIDLGAARVAVHRDHAASSNALAGPDEGMRRWLSDVGLLASLPRGFDLTSLEASEGVIAAGEVVTVLGRARWEVDPDEAPSLRGPPPRRLCLEPDDEGELLVTDERAVVFPAR